MDEILHPLTVHKPRFTLTKPRSNLDDLIRTFTPNFESTEGKGVIKTDDTNVFAIVSETTDGAIPISELKRIWDTLRHPHYNFYEHKVATLAIEVLAHFVVNEFEGVEKEGMKDLQEKHRNE